MQILVFMRCCLKFSKKAGVSPAFLIAKPGEVCYNYIVMKNRIHLYVSRKTR